VFSLVAAPALADNTVTLTIGPGGVLSARVIDSTPLPVAGDANPRRDAGLLHLLVSDPRGTSVGWRVVIAVAVLDGRGDSACGDTVPGSDVRILAVTAPTVLAGQPRTTGGPNYDPLVGASLATPRTVIWAEPGAGSGDYGQTIAFVLDVPALRPAGTCQATLVVTLASAP
jgi:hypothetical protein